MATFGVTLATIDIRQASDRHTEALDAITRALGLGSYAEWDESKRLEFLVRELPNPRPLIPPGLKTSPAVSDVLDTFRMIAQTPPESLGSYVVTMTHQASDVLIVELLQKEMGAQRPLRVVPLLETAADLRRAPEILDRLFAIDGIARASTACRRSWSATPTRRRMSDDSARAGSCSKRRRRSSTRAGDIRFGPRCFTGAVAVSVAAVDPRISRCNRSPRGRSRAGSA